MSMTYEEALEENPSVTRVAAQRLCRIHNTTFDALVAELGDKHEYQAREILIWLGY